MWFYVLVLVKVWQPLALQKFLDHMLKCLVRMANDGHAEIYITLFIPDALEQQDVPMLVVGFGCHYPISPTSLILGMCFVI